MRLLLVEDEKELARALVTVLTYNHYSVDEVYDGEQAVVYLENGNYDGVILDIMPAKLDGISVLKKIRAQGNQVPVLILSARSALEDKVNGLDCGADDYLTKPFATKELLARVRAMTRRRENVMEPNLHFEDLDAFRNFLSAWLQWRMGLPCQQGISDDGNAVEESQMCTFSRTVY